MENKKVINEFSDVEYYKKELSKVGYAKSDYSPTMKVRGEDGESKWLNVNNESVKAFTEWFKGKAKKSIKEEYQESDFFDDFEQDAGMRYKVLEYMLNFFDAEHLLKELISAMGDEAALDNLGYIARLNDVPKKSEYESEEENIDESLITPDDYYSNVLKECDVTKL